MAQPQDRSVIVPGRSVAERLAYWRAMSWEDLVVYGAVCAGEGGGVSVVSKITQIYEGTNQVQRIVMARQLLAGVQSEL